MGQRAAAEPLSARAAASRRSPQDWLMAGSPWGRGEAAVRPGEGWQRGVHPQTASPDSNAMGAVAVTS